MTGSHGYIGRTVIDKLTNCAQVEELIQIDLIEGNRFEEIKNESLDSIFHLAAYTSVEESEKLKSKYIENNVINTIKFVESNKFNRFVFASTNAVFNRSGDKDPSSVYGATKLVIESYLLLEFRRNDGYIQGSHTYGSNSRKKTLSIP